MHYIDVSTFVSEGVVIVICAIYFYERICLIAT